MSEIPIEKDNFLRFICFFIDVGTETVLKVFYYYHHQNPSIVTFPISRTAPIAKLLQKAFFKSQYYNVTKAMKPDDFDINTLITLLRTLFSVVLPTPVNGWEKRPASGDYSISADLLRLRSIRNNIVAHIKEASLSSDEFDKLWKTVEKILKRLVQTVDPGNENKLEETFEAYRQKTIGASTAEKYLDILKKQLDELKQTLRDFILLWKDKQDTPFLRYIKLLVDGGRSILTAYLNKLIKENNAYIHSTLLERQEAVLEKLNGNHAMIEQVYQQNEEGCITVNTNTTDWDLSVLAKVIESLFATSLDEDDLDEIKVIREARENYAYTALYAITSDEPFQREREILVTNLSLLAKSIGRNSKQELNRFIEMYRSPSFEMTSEEVDVYLSQLKWPGLDIKDINDIHRECVEKLKAELSTAVNIDVNVKENFELEIMFELACQDIEKQKEAESTLYNFIKAILADPGLETKEGPDFPEVRQTIVTISDIPTVKLTCVKKSCILITVESNSSQAVISLVDYIDSPKFQYQLEGISTEFKAIFDEVFISKGHFTLESIQKTLVCIEETMSDSNSVLFDDTCAQAPIIIDTCEHMTDETMYDSSPQSGMSTQDRQESSTSSSKTKFEQILMKLEEYQHKSAHLSLDSAFLWDYLKNTTETYHSLKDALGKLTTDWNKVMLELTRKERVKEETQTTFSRHLSFDKSSFLYSTNPHLQFQELSYVFQRELQQGANLARDSDFVAEYLKSAGIEYHSLMTQISLLSERWNDVEKKQVQRKEEHEREKERSQQFKLEISRLQQEIMKLESAPDPRIRKLHKILQDMENELAGEKDRSQQIKLGNVKLEKEKMELASSLEIAEKKLAELKLERSEGNSSSKQVKRERRLSY